MTIYGFLNIQIFCDVSSGVGSCPYMGNGCVYGLIWFPPWVFGVHIKPHSLLLSIKVSLDYQYDVSSFYHVSVHLQSPCQKYKNADIFRESIDTIINSHIHPLFLSTITDSMRTKTCVNPDTIKKH
jgi:hypothetical protein